MAVILPSPATARIRVAVVALSAILLAACAPPRVSRIHTTSTSRLSQSATAEVAREPIATLGVLAPAGLQGFSPFLLHAFAAALAEVAPSLRVMSGHDTVNRLNEHGLATEYAELMGGFARNSILDRDRLRRVGSALGARYVFLPGLAELNHNLVDKYEMVGLKIVRNQVTRLRLWLQVWDVQSGHILWESVGETTVVNTVLSLGQATPLDAIAQALWRRMLEEHLVSRKSDLAPSSLPTAGGGADSRLQ